MKKVLISLLILALVVGLVCLFVACNEGEDLGIVDDNAQTETPLQESDDLFQPTNCTVVFDANGGSFSGGDTSRSVVFEKGSKISLPVAPTRDGYELAHWCVDRDLTTRWDFVRNNIAADITLYAEWAPASLADYIYTKNSTGYTITGVKDKSIKQASIPDCVTKIGKQAFYNCSNLKFLTIGSGVTSIEENAFFHCSSLSALTIPDGVEQIGKYAFYGCVGLTSVTIGSGVTDIGDAAFNGCNKIVEVYNKSNLSILKRSSKHGYVGYCAKEIYTSEYITKLSTDEDGYIIYSDKEEKILMGYTGDETDLILPSTLTSIYRDAFFGRSDLTSVTILEGVASVGEYAFYDCSGLTSVTIPNSVTSIEEYVFYGCSGLTSVEIPRRLKSIGACAYYACTSLRSIYYAGDVAGWCEISGLNEIMAPGRTLYINDEKVQDALVIPDNVTKIGEYAFYGCSDLTSVTIGNKVLNIGNRAFSDCSGLTSVAFGNKLLNIGDYAFSDCSALISVTIPDSVTSIGEYSFSGCGGMSSLTIGNGVTSIGMGAFLDCRSLTSLTIPDSIICIVAYAFSGCFGLNSVTIGSGVTGIKAGVFLGCYKLVEVYNKSSLSIVRGSELFGYAGYYAKAVYTDDYTSKLSTENGYIFYTDGEEEILMGYMGDQSDLTLSATVTSIYQYAFYKCCDLISITIPDSVTSMGDRSFEGCTGLTSITFQGTMAQWNNISKDSSWNNNTGNYTIHCTDGDIAK